MHNETRLAQAMVMGGSMPPNIHKDWKRYHDEAAAIANSGKGDYRKIATDVVIQAKGEPVTLTQVAKQLGHTVNETALKELAKYLTSHRKIHGNYQYAKGAMFHYVEDPPK